MVRRLVSWVLLATVLAGASAGGAEYCLSPSGDDGGPGTRESPWKTIAHANASLQAGDTVIFLDGTYPGVIEPAQSGTGSAFITYRAENGLKAVLKGGKASNGEYLCLRLNGHHHVVIEGFHMLPSKGGWMRLDNANHCVFRRCRMENSTQVYCPIRCEGCSFNRYEDLECWRANGIGKWGHVLGDMWNNFGCSRNLFLRVHISRAGHRPFGLWFDSSHNVVRQCVFDCRWGRNFEFFSSPRVLVEDCVVTNGFDGSGSADGRAKMFMVDGIFRRNIIFRNYYGPLVSNSYTYHDLPTFGMIRSRLYSNTWYRNHEYGFEAADHGSDPAPHMIRGNIFQNNIFAFNDPGGCGLALLLRSNIASDNLFLNNNLYGDRPGCATIRYDMISPGAKRGDGDPMSASEANEKMPKQFMGNMDADPLFVNSAADDFRLKEASPCVDAGHPLTRTLKAGSGRAMAVDDARWFYDGFDIPGERGDLIFVGKAKHAARVIMADIDHDVLTLDRDVSWEQGDRVTLAFAGKAPDLGAYEQGARDEDWYSAPAVPPGLRIETMETANATVVNTDFEPANLEDWHYYWNFSRQRNTDARMDDATAFSGARSMRVFATGDGAIMSCDIRPRWWDIDRFPIVRLAYRIPKGVPVGLWVHAFKSPDTGRGAVCLGGSPAHKASNDLKRYELVDDDAWHEVVLDVRLVREVFPEVKLLQMFRFYTEGNGKEGDKYWFDAFRILPAKEKG